MKKTSSTITTMGIIPHQMHMPTGILCPVKLDVGPKPGGIHPPQLRDGRTMAYALPGGGEFIA